MSGHHSIAGIPLVFGGNIFGWTADENTSFALLDKFYEHGGRMIDTAQGYSAWVPGLVGGESETVIGKWLESRGVRADMRIGTKTNMGGRPGGLAAEKVKQELEKSLERLRTDYVDLYYVHRDEEQTPQEEVAETFDALVRAGKTKEIGASNYTPDRLRTILDLADAHGLVPFTFLQNEYNLLSRNHYGPEMQQLCEQRVIAMLPFFGLASGYLTGKYRTEADFGGSQRGEAVRNYASKTADLLPTMDEIANEIGASLSAIALAWLRRQPSVAAPLASARTVEQLAPLIESTKLELSEEHLRRLSETGT